MTMKIKRSALIIAIALIATVAFGTIFVSADDSEEIAVIEPEVIEEETEIGEAAFEAPDAEVVEIEVEEVEEFATIEPEVIEEETEIGEAIFEEPEVEEVEIEETEVEEVEEVIEAETEEIKEEKEAEETDETAVRTSVRVSSVNTVKTPTSIETGKNSGLGLISVIFYGLFIIAKYFNIIR